MTDRMHRHPDVVAAYAPMRARLFLRYLRFYFRRNFNAVRIAGEVTPEIVDDVPLIVYSNHPAWWDPILFFLASADLFPDRRPFGPMDAEALAKYQFMRRLGIFGVDRDPRRGAIQFLRNAENILSKPGTMLWITAQGRFSDVRERPLGLQPGLARLLARVPQARVLPVAVEYPFWEERRPEALLRVGSIIRNPDIAHMDNEGRTHLLEAALEAVMDKLAVDAASRQPAAFRTLLCGESGISLPYDLARRLRHVIAGRHFNPAHGSKL